MRDITIITPKLVKQISGWLTEIPFVSSFIDTISPVALIIVYFKLLNKERFSSQVVFLLALFAWTVIWIIVREFRRKAKSDFQMALRQTLINVRKNLVLLRRHLAKKTVTLESIDCCINEALSSIFNAISDNNRDLNRHFRVVLMEPGDNSHLSITNFANSTNDEPNSMIVGKKIKKGEGCAGNAWLHGRPIVVDSVPKMIKSIAERRRKAEEKGIPFNEREMLFYEMYQDQSDKIKSIVSIPIPKLHGKSCDGSTEEVILDIFGVLCIDTDIDGFFDSHEGISEMEKRVRIFPFINYLQVLYYIRELCKLKVQIGVVT